MKIGVAKKIACEVERYPMEAPFVLQKDQYRSYVMQKLGETLVEQVDEDGNIFIDKYLHPQCEFIGVVKPDWN
jgi:hypothetical protein